MFSRKLSRSFTLLWTVSIMKLHPLLILNTLLILELHSKCFLRVSLSFLQTKININLNQLPRIMAVGGFFSGIIKFFKNLFGEGESGGRSAPTNSQSTNPPNSKTTTNTKNITINKGPSTFSLFGSKESKEANSYASNILSKAPSYLKAKFKAVAGKVKGPLKKGFKNAKNWAKQERKVQEKKARLTKKFYRYTKKFFRKGKKRNDEIDKELGDKNVSPRQKCFS